VEIVKKLWGVDSRTLHQVAQVVSDSGSIGALLQFLDLSQILSADASTCLFDYSLSFVDRTGKELGEVGICHLPGHRTDHPAVFILPGENGRPGVRHGLRVPDGPELAEMLTGLLDR
jgi:hypothetical protein